MTRPKAAMTDSQREAERAYKRAYLRRNRDRINALRRERYATMTPEEKAKRVGTWEDDHPELARERRREQLRRWNAAKPRYIHLGESGGPVRILSLPAEWQPVAERLVELKRELRKVGTQNG
jgi:hypothetical protein